MWADKQQYLRTETIEAVRKLGATLIHFTPDPYFTLAWKGTRLLDEAMRAFDLLIYCKSYEQAAYAVLGNPLVDMPLDYCERAIVHCPAMTRGGDARLDFLGAGRRAANAYCMPSPLPVPTSKSGVDTGMFCTMAGGRPASI